MECNGVKSSELPHPTKDYNDNQQLRWLQLRYYSRIK